MNITDNPSSRPPISPKSNSMNLKKQLKYYLERDEITASQLARKANVPKQSLSGWLAGSNPRDVKQVKRVADALNITLDNLLFGEGPEPQSQKAIDLGSLVGDEWFSGIFEMKIRRVKR
ncbi:MAG: helix-turn-helix transcriptional regulator [Bdellovibrionaceae bacterium]|nr:helix-turn-helix transcriptional regulator [Pseudobdellovibrionaceae bacterium]